MIQSGTLITDVLSVARCSTATPYANSPSPTRVFVSPPHTRSVARWGSPIRVWVAFGQVRGSARLA